LRISAGQNIYFKYILKSILNLIYLKGEIEKMEYINDFSNEEKINAFDDLVQKYYDKNFGTFSKTDIDTFMFSKLVQHYFNNKNKYDDYDLSIMLGISQQRIRNLRVAQQLRYPQKLEWEESLALCVENAHFDRDTMTFKITIQDPNIMNEIKHFIENKGGYIEVHLNNKLLQIKSQYFVLLLLELNGKDNESEIIEKIRKQLKKDEQTDSELTKESMSTLIAGEGIQVIASILECFPGGSIASKIALAAGNIILKK